MQAELLAIRNALKWVLATADPRLPTADFTVLSDSRSALQAIADRNSTNALVVDIHNLLRRAASAGSRPTLVWVKAHVGIIGNERADELAKLATTSPGAPDFNLTPLSFVKSAIRQRVNRLWQRRYAEAADMSRRIGKHHVAHHLPTVASSRRLRKQQLPTFELTQVLTGHGPFLANLHRFKRATTDKCRCDESPDAPTQTCRHLVEDCPIFARQRASLPSRSLALHSHLAHDNDSLAFVKFASNIATQAMAWNGTRRPPRSVALPPDDP